MEGYDLLMIFWSGFLIFGLFMAYQDYRKWITSNEANKSLSLREIFSIFGQGIVFVTIALAGIIFFTLNQHLIQQVKQLIIILALLAVSCSDNFRELNCESSSDENRSYIFNNQSVQVITSEDEASWSCDYFRQTQDFLRCKGLLSRQQQYGYCLF